MKIIFSRLKEEKKQHLGLLLQKLAYTEQKFIFSRLIKVIDLA